jgi:pimeloyl-ACP methyl ester carboxylesterase
MPFAHRPLRFLTPKKIRPEVPLFVFLPGMDGTGQLLRAQTAGLETAFDVRCLVIPSDDLTSWADLTEQTVRLIQAEMQNQGDRTVYLCGESFGACLAMKVALHSPQLFERVILVNPASSFHRRPWIHWGSQITRLLPEPLYRVSCVTLMPFLASLGKIGADDRQALLEAMLSVTQESSIWRLSLLQQFDVTESDLQRITQPVLLVVGGGDRLLPSRNEAELLMDCLPQAQIYVLPTSGHACLLESDVSLYKIMQESHFLETNGLEATNSETGRARDKTLVNAN